MLQLSRSTVPAAHQDVHEDQGDGCTNPRTDERGVHCLDQLMRIFNSGGSASYSEPQNYQN